MPALPRFFANDQPISRRDPYKQLIASLERLVTQYPPDSIPPGGGLFYGPTSIAFLFFTLNNFYKDFTIEDIPMGTWCAVYLKQSQDAMKQYPGPTADKCGVMDDILALIALSAASSRDAEMARELCDFAAVAIDEPGGSNEWLYGRAGFLYLLRLVKASFSDDQETLDMIEDTADEIIEKILAASRPWKWHETAYVGAVHGAIGIITQIVLTDPTFANQLEPELGALLTYQLESGNWPSKLPGDGDRLVHFCHGAPGVITSLLSIKEYFPSLGERIDKAIDAGRTEIKKRGLLTKEPCLCHGINGNALALEDPDFEHFLTYTTASEIRALDNDGMMEHSSQPSGLYTGEAGRAWTWAVADKGLERRFLGYNDL